MTNRNEIPDFQILSDSIGTNVTIVFTEEDLPKEVLNLLRIKLSNKAGSFRNLKLTQQTFSFIRSIVTTELQALINSRRLIRNSISNKWELY